MRSAMPCLGYRHGLAHPNSNSFKWWSLCHWSRSPCWAAHPQAWRMVPWKNSRKSQTGFERPEHFIICHDQEVVLMVLGLNACILNTPHFAYWSWWSSPKLCCFSWGWWQVISPYLSKQNAAGQSYQLTRSESTFSLANWKCTLL